MADTKGRILFLERYMLEHTDDEHSITTDELISIYEENGYKANRNTIRDDVAVLNAAGIEILSERVGNGKVYHIGARLFELAELKMLVDAVSSSRFIQPEFSRLTGSKPLIQWFFTPRIRFAGRWRMGRRYGSITGITILRKSIFSGMTGNGSSLPHML